jgi:hypothetical protein
MAALDSHADQPEMLFLRSLTIPVQSESLRSLNSKVAVTGSY